MYQLFLHVDRKSPRQNTCNDNMNTNNCGEWNPQFAASRPYRKWWRAREGRDVSQQLAVFLCWKIATDLFFIISTTCCFPPCKLTRPHFMPRADLGLPPMERNHFPLPWVHITSSKRRQTQQLYKLFKPVEECSFVTVAVEGAGFILVFLPSEMEI